jgi:hypothetical protein
MTARCEYREKREMGFESRGSRGIESAHEPRGKSMGLHMVDAYKRFLDAKSAGYREAVHDQYLPSYSKALCSVESSEKVGPHARTSRNADEVWQSPRRDIRRILMLVLRHIAIFGSCASIYGFARKMANRLAHQKSEVLLMRLQRYKRMYPFVLGIIGGHLLVEMQCCGRAPIFDGLLYNGHSRIVA